MIKARSASVALALGAVLASVGAVPAAAAGPPERITAFADGRPIAIEDIPDYYCDDFSYPVIQCSSIPLVSESRAMTAALFSAADYVTIYENPTYVGSYMHLSQDYTALLFIGWNDRISSFKGRNSESGTFNTNWFYGGTSWSFCCNANVTTLNAYDNTFSSVRRT